MTNNIQPATEPDHNSHNRQSEPAAEPRPAPARKNPRLVIGTLDYFDMLMEQDEQG